MRALVSGAQGFIGRALVGGLVARGDEVRRIVRSDPGPDDVLLDLAARRLRGPGGDGLEGVDAVVHLAGEPITPTRWSPAKRDRIHSSRVLTTEAIARTIATSEHPPAVFVSGSASGYYGSRGEERLDEASTSGEGFLAGVCRAWEAATVAARERGVRVAIVRTSIVIGDGGLVGALGPLFRVGLGARLGSGRQWMSWISLADVAAAIVFLVEDGSLTGAVNLCSPNPVRNVDFTAALAAHYRRHARLAVPRTALRLALGRRARDEFVLASQRIAPARLVASGFSFARADLADALGALAR